MGCRFLRHYHIIFPFPLKDSTPNLSLSFFFSCGLFRFQKWGGGGQERGRLQSHKSFGTEGADAGERSRYSMK